MRVAIIPARKGSKRILNKNIKKFCGKPIIFWPLDIIRKSNFFQKVIVSTDCKQIAKLSKQYGAEVPFLRPKNISGDRTGIQKVVIHTINWLKKKYFSPIEVCCIFPTAVFLEIKDVKSAYAKLKKEKKWDYVFSATKNNSNFLRSFNLSKRNKINMIKKSFYNLRTQELPDTYHDAGQFYWAKDNTWKKKQKIFSKKSTITHIPSYRSHDIDTIEDWRCAEILFKNYHKKNFF